MEGTFEVELVPYTGGQDGRGAKDTALLRDGAGHERAGQLGAVIGFMTWLWISAIVILIGAEVDAEMEHQTARDTRTGAPRPTGRRGARMADTLGPAQTA